MRFSTVGMSNEAAKLHNVSRTKSRRASESGPMVRSRAPPPLRSRARSYAPIYLPTL